MKQSRFLTDQELAQLDFVLVQDLSHFRSISNTSPEMMDELKKNICGDARRVLPDGYPFAVAYRHEPGHRPMAVWYAYMKRGVLKEWLKQCNLVPTFAEHPIKHQKDSA